MPARTRWLIAVSLGNLLLAREFTFLLSWGPESYWAPEIPAATYLGVLLVWLILSAAALVVLKGADEAKSRWVRTGCDLLLVACLMWVGWTFRNLSRVAMDHPALSV